MKLRFLLCLFFTISLFSCNMDEEVPVFNFEINNVTIIEGYKSTDISFSISTTGKINTTGIVYSENANFENANFKKAINSETDIYMIKIDSLSAGHTYFFKYYIENKYGDMTSSQIDTFHTQSYKLPSIRIDSIWEITINSARCQFTMLEWGSDTLPITGVCFGTHSNLTTKDSCILLSLNQDSDTTYSFQLTELTDNMQYYIRAFATNTMGTAYSNELSFTTREIYKPSVITGDVSEINYTDMVCTGNVTADGGSLVLEKGICYDIYSEPTISDKKIMAGPGIGDFTCHLLNLKAGTIYYVRAFATNIKGTSYGDCIPIKTRSYTEPTIETKDATDITFTSARCGGIIISDGGDKVIEKGICYSTMPNPSLNNKKEINNDESTDFSCILNGLKAGTKYYVRAYATNQSGTAYGEMITFTTAEYSLPEVTTYSATDVTYTTAICGGSITADGGQSIIARGVCYSTSQDPTIFNSKVQNGIGIGDYSCNLTGLAVGTTYYVRAYATNSVGTAYGNQVLFQTTPPTAPTVETLSCFFDRGIICNGSVISNGSDIIECGFCYSSISVEPSITDSHIISSINGDAVVDTIMDFHLNTTYYICAYARNSQGIAYGQVVTFKTPEAPTISILNSSYYTCTNTSTNTWRTYIFISIDNPYDLPISQVGFYHEHNWPTSTAPDPFFYPSYVLSHTYYHPIYCSYDANSNTYQGSGGVGAGNIDINSWYAIGFYVCYGDTTTTGVVSLNKKTFY